MNKINVGQILVNLQEEVAALKADFYGSDASSPDRPRVGSMSSSPYAPPVTLTIGVITEVIPFYGNYVVNIEGATSPLMCSRASDCSTAATSVSASGTLVPGDEVLVARHRSRLTGVIIGVLPQEQVDRRLGMHDQVSQFGPISRAADPYTVNLLARPTQDVQDFSGSKPLDESGVGEFSRGCAATGSRLHVDPYLAFVRASEECGVWSFVHDDLLRVRGRTIQVIHPGGDSEVSSLGTQVYSLSGFTPFAWEALGAPNSDVVASQAVTAEESQVNNPYKASTEPISASQAPIYRFTVQNSTETGGELQQVLLPSIGATTVNSLQSPNSTACLLDEHKGLDGRWHTTGRMGFEMSVRPGLTTYAPTNRPEDRPVDFAMPNPLPAGTLPSGLGSALVLDDLFAYRQWVSGAGLESAGYRRMTDGSQDTVPSFSSLSTSHEFEDPEPEVRALTDDLQIQSYPRGAGYTVMPNGTVVLFGPCGEEIRMGGGTIELIAPNVTIRSGRDTVILSGRDTAIRAHRSIDIASANQDVNVKAERNLQMLAGNSGVGTVLIESRSDSSNQTFGDNGTAGGIILKTSGDLVQYCRTLFTDANSTVITQASGQIISVAESSINYLNNGRFDYYGSNEEPSHASIFGPTTILGTTVQVVGRLDVTEGGSFGDTVSLSSGHILTADADQYNNLVPGLTEDSIRRATERNEQVVDQGNKRVTDAGILFSDILDENFGSSGRPGNDLTQAQTAFGFRSSETIGTTNFQMYEGRWQQKARMSGQSLSTWNEPLVIGPTGEGTMPYPGYQAWTSPCLSTVDLLLYDVATGLPIDNRNVYVSATYPSPTPTTPAASYLVIG